MVSAFAYPGDNPVTGGRPPLEITPDVTMTRTLASRPVITIPHFPPILGPVIPATLRDDDQPTASFSKSSIPASLSNLGIAKPSTIPAIVTSTVDPSEPNVLATRITRDVRSSVTKVLPVNSHSIPNETTPGITPKVTMTHNLASRPVIIIPNFPPVLGPVIPPTLIDEVQPRSSTFAKSSTIPGSISSLENTSASTIPARITSAEDRIRRDVGNSLTNVLPVASHSHVSETSSPEITPKATMVYTLASRPVITLPGFPPILGPVIIRTVPFDPLTSIVQPLASQPSVNIPNFSPVIPATLRDEVQPTVL